MPGNWTFENRNTRRAGNYCVFCSQPIKNRFASQLFESHSTPHGQAFGRHFVGYVHGWECYQDQEPPEETSA